MKKKKLTNVLLEANTTMEIVDAAEGEPSKRPTMTIEAYNGGLLRVANIMRPVVIDLNGIRAGRVTILKDHDRSQIVGQGTAKITKSKIVVTARITGDVNDPTSPAGHVVAHSKNGFVWPASVGVSVDDLQYVEAKEKVNVNGRVFAGPIAVARKGRLGETSLVSIGADETAFATIAAQCDAANTQENTMKTFAQWLSAMGFDPDNVPEEQTTQLQAAYDEYVALQAPKKAENPKEEEPKPAVNAAAPVSDIEATIEANRQALADEAARVAEINKVCASHPDIAAQAIREGWPAMKAENAVLVASRPKAPAVHASNGVTMTDSVIEAGIMMGSALGANENSFSAETLQAAHTAFGRGGIGLGEVVLRAAEQNTGRRYSYRRDGVKEILAAAFSTQALTGILANTANKFLLDGYTYGDNSDLAIASKRSVSDFKTITSYRLTGNTMFQEVGPGGELHHATVSEDSFTNKAKTYGIMHSLTRADIINDDLGAFDDLRRLVGMGAAMKRRDVFWTAFMDNSTFFASGNSNYQSGATTALSMDSLTAAIRLMRDQQDDNGRPIAIEPALLVVPTALEGSAMSLFKSGEIRDTTASTVTLTANIHMGKFSPLVSTFLGNSSYTGYSDTAWYLLADPRALSVIEMCYLNGVESPTIETADADFNTLGIQLRGYFDFGVEKQDPKAGVKSAGT